MARVKGRAAPRVVAPTARAGAPREGRREAARREAARKRGAERRKAGAPAAADASPFAGDRTLRSWAGAPSRRRPTGLSSAPHLARVRRPEVAKPEEAPAAADSPVAPAEDPIAGEELRTATARARARHIQGAARPSHRTDSGPQASRLDSAEDRWGRGPAAARAERGEDPKLARGVRPAAALRGALREEADTEGAAPGRAAAEVRPTPAVHRERPEPVAARRAAAAGARPIVEGPAAVAPRQEAHQVDRRVAARPEAPAQAPQDLATRPRGHRKTDKTCLSAGCLRHTACRRS